MRSPTKRRAFWQGTASCRGTSGYSRWSRSTTPRLRPRSMTSARKPRNLAPVRNRPPFGSLPPSRAATRQDAGSPPQKSGKTSRFPPITTKVLKAPALKKSGRERQALRPGSPGFLPRNCTWSQITSTAFRRLPLAAAGPASRMSVSVTCPRRNSGWRVVRPIKMHRLMLAMRHLLGLVDVLPLFQHQLHGLTRRFSLDMSRPSLKAESRL